MYHSIIAFLDPTVLFGLIGQLFPSFGPLLSATGWATTGTFVGIILVASELLDKWKHLDGNLAKARTLIVGMILGLVGYILGWGMFGDPAFYNAAIVPAWAQALFIGGYCAIVSWGVWAIGIGQQILQWLHIRVPAPPDKQV